MFNWAVLGGLVPATPFKVGHRLGRASWRARRRGRAGCSPGKRNGCCSRRAGYATSSSRRSRPGCRLGRAAVAAVVAGRARSVPAGGEDEGEETAPRCPSPACSGPSWTHDGTIRRVSPYRPTRSCLGTKWAAPRVAQDGVAADVRAREDHGLHFHDLRREAGSRWMDAGVPLATIQRWLGHHNISQTSTYLAASGGGDADAMRAFEQAIGAIAANCRILRIEQHLNRPHRHRDDRKDSIKTRSCTNRQGSCTDWGSRGRGFESRHPDHFFHPPQPVARPRQVPVFSSR